MTDFSVVFGQSKVLSGWRFSICQAASFLLPRLGEEALFVCAHWHIVVADFTSTRSGIHEAEKISRGYHHPISWVPSPQPDCLLLSIFQSLLIFVLYYIQGFKLNSVGRIRKSISIYSSFPEGEVLSKGLFKYYIRYLSGSDRADL